MPRIKRKSDRRTFERRAWVDLTDGSPVIECSIKNISDTGSLLVFGAPKDVPEKLILLLLENRQVARKCRVVWKSGTAIGVEFIGRLAQAERHR
jgi:hypothetical protein